MSFVSAPIDVDPNSLLNEAISDINTNLATAGFPDWSANSGNFEIIVLQTIAQMASDVAQVSSIVLPAVFRAFGTQLFNVPYENGSPSTILSSWSFTSPAPANGYTIEAGTAVIIDNQVFTVQNDATATVGQTSLDNLLLVSAQAGTAFNGLGTSGTASPYNQIDFVASISLTGLSTGGVDQETDDDYQNRLAQALQLQSPRPIVTNDFANIVQSIIAVDALSDPTVNPLGIVTEAAGRATAINLYYPAGRQASNTPTTVTLKYHLTNGSNIAYLDSSNSSSIIGVVAPKILSTVTGTGIPSSTVVQNVTPPSTVADWPVPNTPFETGVHPFDPYVIQFNNPATTTGVETLTFSALVGVTPKPLQATVSFTSGSVTATITSPPFVGAFPDVGAHIVSANVLPGTTITAVNGNTLTLNQNGATTGSATAYISAWWQVPGCVTTFVTDELGNFLLSTPAADTDLAVLQQDSALTLDAMQEWLTSKSSFNLSVNVAYPGWTQLAVSTEVKALPGFTSAAIVTNVTNAISNFLNQQTWGNPLPNALGTNTWLNSTQGYNVVRFNDLLGVVFSAAGVQTVVNLFFGPFGTTLGTSDLTLPGPAPLVISAPEMGETTIIVTVS